MALPHFFLEEQVLERETEPLVYVRLSKDDLAHARVLRLKPPEHIALIDAEGVYYECEIVLFDKAGLFVQISRKEISRSKKNPPVMLALGLTKSHKMDTVMRGATELGVSGFIPFRCERSVVKMDEKKNGSRLSRWRTVVKNAAMQSGQLRLPSVDACRSLDELCLLSKEADLVLICWEEEGKTQIGEALKHTSKSQSISREDAQVLVVIGPEGGLTPSEIALMQSSNPSAFTVSLGPSILRAETAGIVAAALTLYELGGMK